MDYQSTIAFNPVTTKSNTPPAALTAIQAAILINGCLHTRDIVAFIYDLAYKGFVLIKQKDGELFIIRKPDFVNNIEFLEPFEQDLLAFIAPPTEEKSLQVIINSTSAEDFKTLVTTVEAAIRRNLITYGIVTEDLSLTEDGKEIQEKIALFKEYLTLPIDLGNDSEQGLLFYQHLAYALILNCEDAWLGRFDKRNFYIPLWFQNGKLLLGLRGFWQVLEQILKLFEISG